MNNVGINFRGIEQPVIGIDKKIDDNKPIEENKEENIKPQEFSQEASDALRASVLYKQPEQKMSDGVNCEKDNNDITESKDENFEKTVGDIEKDVNIDAKSSEPAEIKEYIPKDATPQDVRDILADKSKVGRSFFGYKRALKNIVKSSNEPQRAIENLNYLLNVDDGKLSALDVTNIMNITEVVNNGKNKNLSKHYSEKFDFKGGKLDNESYKKISDKIKEQRKIAFLFSSALLSANIQRQQDMDMMNQQIMIDQMNQQQLQMDMMNQQMINQQMMSPPMGM